MSPSSCRSQELQASNRLAQLLFIGQSHVPFKGLLAQLCGQRCSGQRLRILQDRKSELHTVEWTSVALPGNCLIRSDGQC